MIKHALLAGAAAALLFTAPAEAAIVKYKFTTTITAMQDINFTTFIGTPITSSTMSGNLFKIGDTAHGWFAYDTEHPGGPIFPNYAFYNGPSATTASWLHFDNTGVEFTTRPGDYTSITLTDNPGYEMFDYLTGVPSMTYWERMQIILRDTGSGLDGVALPLSLPDSMFSNVIFSYAWIRYSDNQAMTAEGTFTSFERVVEAEVPEPATLGLISAGLGLLGLRRRRA